MPQDERKQLTARICCHLGWRDCESTYMSIDAQRVQDLVTYLHVVWSGIFQIAIALYLLYVTTAGPSLQVWLS